MVKKWESWLPALLFISLFIFAAYSNIFDWDHFLAAAEADLRSWMIWGEAPVWSYLFCGGVTRAGDPQAYGLSPLFLSHIIFGSFWGWKVLIVLTATVGYHFMRRLQLHFFPGLNANFSRLVILTYIFGNFFLWHVHHGHLTFLLNYLVLGLLYYFLRATQGALRLRELLWVSLLSWAIFSAGFYHTSVFFGLPLAISCVLFFCLVFVRPASRKNFPIRAMGSFLLFLSVGIAGAIYKWGAVLGYQLENPRVVESFNETMTFVGFLKNLFLPTKDYQFLGFLGNEGPWGIWEYSAFSLVAWLFLFMVVVLLIQKKRLDLSSNIAKFSLIFLGVSTAFYLGGDSIFYPFKFVNEVFLSNSVRVIGRFGHNLTLAFLLLVFLMAEKLPRISNFLGKRSVYALSILILLLNFLSFSPTLFNPLPPKFFAELDFNPDPEMRAVMSTRPRTDRQSFMYEPILAGVAVLNCYNPIARESVVVAEMSELALKLEAKPLPFIQFDSAPSEDCIRDTFFTASKLRVGKACPSGCFLLNQLKPEDAALYVRDPVSGHHCFKKE